MGVVVDPVGFIERETLPLTLPSRGAWGGPGGPGWAWVGGPFPLPLYVCEREALPLPYQQLLHHVLT